MNTILDPRICSFLDEPRGDRRARKIMPPLYNSVDEFDNREKSENETYFCATCGNTLWSTAQMWTATQCRECREKEMKCDSSLKNAPVESARGEHAHTATNHAVNGAGTNEPRKDLERAPAVSAPCSSQSNVGKRMKLCDMPVGTTWLDGNDHRTHHVLIGHGWAIQQTAKFKWQPKMDEERSVLAYPVIEVGDLVEDDEPRQWRVAAVRKIDDNFICVSGSNHEQRNIYANGKCRLSGRSLTIIEKGSK